MSASILWLFEKTSRQAQHHRRWHLQVVLQQPLRVQAGRLVHPWRQLQAEVHELLPQPRLPATPAARHLRLPCT